MLKTLGTVLLIIASMVGFVFSYGFAYNKIARFMNANQEQSNSSTLVAHK